MKKILISLGVVGLVCGVLLIVAVVRIGRTIHEAEGRAFYSALGASTRIDEFAHSTGKSNYIAEADSRLALIKGQLDLWRQTASAADIATYEKMQASAYQTTDRNIKSGLNPLAYLDMPNNPPQPTAVNAPVSTNQ